MLHSVLHAPHNLLLLLLLLRLGAFLYLLKNLQHFINCPVTNRMYRDLQACRSCTLRQLL
jgi:hypothetical protein